MDKKLQSKSFCKWDKDDIATNIDAIFELTAKPKYVCARCARVARCKTNVCKPHKFAKK